MNELTVPEPHSNYFQSIGTKSSVHNVRDELTQISVMLVSIAIFCYQMTSSSHRFNVFYLFLHGQTVSSKMQKAFLLYAIVGFVEHLWNICLWPEALPHAKHNKFNFGLLVRNIAEDLQIYISSFAASLYF